jgi:serine/threonine protein kinase/Tfp pilus assembly protein PilF
VSAEDQSAVLEEDQLASLLVACDEALAAGELPTSLCDAGASPGQQPRLRRNLDCLQVLRKLWPRRELGPSGLERRPNRIGRFEIRRELGRGGFGVVFLAYDPKLCREVALKVPRADVLVTPQLRARFQQEAQAAAVLDHPNLVSVFEAGEVGPVSYIATAYCPGITLAQWLRQRSDPVPYEEAARLVQVLAEAIQYAHGRGVLHRDLKPANIMLQEIDGGQQGDTLTGVASCLRFFTPKIADFGLAKILDAPAVQTQNGALLGTPCYMAPEQGKSLTGQVGPGADIYALGVILYELLTGRPPFQAETGLATLALACDTEPVPPSRLRYRLPLDLETICLKCLQKKPEHRYATAAALADDLRRFLSNEPIRARPVSSLERCARWCRRKPLAAALTASLILAVIMGVAGVLWQWRRAEANAVLLAAERDTALQERERAETNFRRARSAVERVTRLARELQIQPGTQRAMRPVLEEALSYYREFLQQKGDDPEIRREAAIACGRVGVICHDLGRFAEAEDAFSRSVETLELLHEEFPEKRVSVTDLVWIYKGQANLRKDAGKLKLAEDVYRKAIAFGEALAREEPDNPAFQGDLANTLINYCIVIKADPKRFAEAENLYARTIDLQEKALAARPRNIRFREELALSHDDLGQLLWLEGRRAEAEASCRRALRMRESIAKDNPANRRFFSYLARSQQNLTAMLIATGRSKEAELTLEECIPRLNQLVTEYPDLPLFRMQLLDALRTLFLLCTAPAQQQRADALCRQMLAHDEKLASQLAGSKEAQEKLARHRLEVGIALAERQHYQQAIGEFRRSLKIYPDGPGANNELAWLLVTCPDTSLRNPKEALPHAENAVRLEHREANYRNTLGVVRYRNGDFKGTIAALEKAVALSSGGTVSDWLFLGMAHWQLNARKEALQWVERATSKMDRDKMNDAETLAFRAEARALIGSNPSR